MPSASRWLQDYKLVKRGWGENKCVKAKPAPGHASWVCTQTVEQRGQRLFGFSFYNGTEVHCDALKYIQSVHSTAPSMKAML